jgi:hypothetical protein
VAVIASISHLGPLRPTPARVVAGVTAVVSVVFGWLAGQAVATGSPTGVLVVFALAVPVVAYRAPRLVILGLLAGACLVEQTPVAGVSGLITDQVPLFKGLSPNAHGNASDALVLLLVAVLVLRGSFAGATRMPRTPLARAVMTLLGAVLVGVVVGVSHHADTRIALMEVRPYIYLAVAYVSTAAFLSTRAALRAVLWLLVVTSGLKAAQALIAFWSVRNQDPRPEAVLGHEEAYLFGVFIMLVLALWLFDLPGRLRTTATWLVPIVLAGDMVNSRRTAWLILGAGVLVLGVISAVSLPARRRFLTRLLIGTLVFSSVYVPAFWNQTGTLGQPARAVHSFISPDPRDAASNLYRVQENANLTLNIKQGGVLGKGFGVPIDYALPIVDISKSDPLITYIPHNGVLYIVMRMGLFGAVAFWSLLGIGIITGCRLARSADRELGLVGAVVACSLVGYALEGYNDQGFFFYRIAVVVGVLLGLLEVARRFDPSHTLDTPPPAVVGS